MLDRRKIRDHRGHHPWRTIGLFPHWKVRFTNDLEPGTNGLTLHGEHRILIRDGLTEEARRSTVCHEIGHVLRGPGSSAHVPYEEALVERQAARLLIPSIYRISRTMAWHGADYRLTSKELWVDEKLFNARLSTLARWEREHLQEQLATIFV